jgi:hypothetical protein
MANRNKEARSIANQLGYENAKIKLIAGGISGGIYNIGDTGTVLKVMKARKSVLTPITGKLINVPYYGTNLRNTEINLQRRMARLWLAPPVLSKYILGSGKTYGGFLMKKLPPNTIKLGKYYDAIETIGPNNFHNVPENVKKMVTNAKYYEANVNTMENKFDKFFKNVKKMVTNAIIKMHRAGIHHGDLHNENIMVTYDPKTLEVERVWIIDYGAATYIPIGYTFTNLVQAYTSFGNNEYVITKNNPNFMVSMPNYIRQNILNIPKNQPRNPFIRFRKLPNSNYSSKSP